MIFIQDIGYPPEGFFNYVDWVVQENDGKVTRIAVYLLFRIYDYDNGSGWNEGLREWTKAQNQMSAHSLQEAYAICEREGFKFKIWTTIGATLKEMKVFQEVVNRSVFQWESIINSSGKDV